LPNPVGYNRAYVHIEGPVTYEKWRDGLLAGRALSPNGPLLRCRVNGQLPGHVFKSDRPIELTLDARLDSRDPIKSIELVRNGIVEPSICGGADCARRRPSFTIDRSGWFLVRAITDVTNTFRFASTAPWYVEIAGRPPTVPRESAQFFVDWCQQRIDILEKRADLSAAQKKKSSNPGAPRANSGKQNLSNELLKSDYAAGRTIVRGSVMEYPDASGWLSSPLERAQVCKC
jgi:hypothetical protein